MKAIFFEEHGGPENLKFADLPDPEPGPGEVLVRVKAVALNHLDIWVRKGWKGLNLDMPHIGGSDIAGEIIEVNAPTKSWQAGTRVVVNPGVNLFEDEWTQRGEDSLSPGYRLIGEQFRGGLAELVCVPVQNVFHFPQSLSFAEAAAPLLVGTTCWRMLVNRAGLRPGETVLVVGAGGGVNSLSIPLAKKMGARVIALTSSEEKEQKATELGADATINYRSHPKWAIEVLRRTQGRGADVVIDNIGKASIEQSIRAVARGGRIITVGNTTGAHLSFDNRFVFTKQISYIGSTMGSRQDFIDAMQFLWNNDIKAPIDRIEPLADGIKMLKYLEEGKQFGKIVLQP